MKFWEQPKRVRHTIMRKKRGLENKLDVINHRIEELETWLGEMKRNKHRTETELNIIRNQFNLPK